VRRSDQDHHVSRAWWPGCWPWRRTAERIASPSAAASACRKAGSSSQRNKVRSPMPATAAALITLEEVRRAAIARLFLAPRLPLSAICCHHWPGSPAPALGLPPLKAHHAGECQHGHHCQVKQVLIGCACHGSNSHRPASAFRSITGEKSTCKALKRCGLLGESSGLVAQALLRLGDGSQLGGEKIQARRRRLFCLLTLPSALGISTICPLLSFCAGESHPLKPLGQLGRW